MKGLKSRYEYNLRIPWSLKVKLEEKAAQSHRSLNAEICVALERYVKESYRII
jgi:predicted HicB family RNase H-like nuclease